MAPVIPQVMSNPASSYSVRKAVAEDLGAIIEIEKRVHVAPWDEAHFRAELDKAYSTTLVMTVFWILYDETQILNLAVDLPYRGLGIARELIRKVVSLGLKKETQRVILEVRKSNQAAIQLYQSMKFTISQVRKGFYSDGEDAYTMVLDLTEHFESPQEKAF
jgi:ribosomal-protein-alanine N-acetyltransferase